MNREKILKILERIIEISILAIVFLTPIIFAFFQETFNVFELYKQVFFRSVLLLVLSAYVGKIFLVGKIKLLVDSKIFILTLLTSLAFFISSFFSLHPELSFWGSYGRIQGFYSLTSYLLFFILLVLNLRDWRQVKNIIIVVISSTALVSLYGLVQYFGIDLLDWTEKALDTGRIFSSFGQPNLLGHFMIMTLPLTLFSGFFIFKKDIVRFFVFFLALTQIFCVLFTYSRSAWLGLLACLGLFVVLYLFIKNYRKLAWSLIGVGAIILASLVIFNFYYHPNYILRSNNIVNRFASAFDLKSGSNRIRFYYWQASLQEFKQASIARKLFGFGPDALDDVFAKYYRPEWGIHETINSFPDRAHNSFFDTVLQFGLFGLTLVLLFYGYIIILAIKYLRRAEINKKYWLITVLLISLVGYFINNLFSFSLSVAYIYLFIIFALILFVISGENKEKELELYWLSDFSRILIWVFLFIVILFFIFFQNLNYLRADYYYVQAKKAEIKGDCSAVLADLEKMTELSSLSFYKERYVSDSLNCFSAVESREGRINLHDNIVEKANSIGPREYRFYTWLNIAHAKSLLGFYINNDYYKSAQADYARLVKINPYITTIYKDLGRMELWQNNYEEALINFKKAIENMPPLDSLYLNSVHRKEIETELVQLYEMTGLAFSHKKDYENALDYYKKALDFDPYHLRVYKRIADVYYEEGDLNKAIWYNERGHMLAPNDYSWPFGIALLYGEKGEKENVRKYAQEALRLAPDNEQVKLLLK